MFNINIWATFFLLLSFQNNTYAAEKKEIIKIAYIGGLSGPGVGKQAAHAFTLLSELIKITNDSNKLKYFKLELHPYDNQFIHSKNIEIATDVAKDGMKIVTGIHYSNDALILAPLLENFKIPTLITTASHPEVIGDKKYIHRLCFSDINQAKVISSGLAKADYKQIYFVRDTNNSFSITLTKLILEDLKKITKDVNFEIIDVTRNEIDTNKFKKLELHKNSAVFLSTNVPDSAQIIMILHNKRIKTDYWGSDAWSSLEIEKALENYNLKSVKAKYTSHWVPNYRESAWLDILNLGLELNVEVSPYLADPIITYEAGLLIIEILSRMKSFNTELFNNQIRKTKLNGIYGPIKINSNGESERQPFLIEIKNSKISGLAK